MNSYIQSDLVCMLVPDYCLDMVSQGTCFHTRMESNRQWILFDSPKQERRENDLQSRRSFVDVRNLGKKLNLPLSKKNTQKCFQYYLRMNVLFIYSFCYLFTYLL